MNEARIMGQVRMQVSVLPAGFEPLEQFVEYWDCSTTQARWERRAAASMEDIRRFYDAMMPYTVAAMNHVREYPLTAMPEPTARLMRLCLALVNASIAVEMHRAPRVPLAPYPHSVKLVQGPVYWG